MARALAIHMGADGLQHLGDVVERAMPERIPISDLSETTQCSDGDLTPLAYTLDSMDLQIGVQNVALEPSEGRLDLWITLFLSSTTSSLHVAGDCSFLSDLDEVCTVELPVTAAEAHVGIAIGTVDGVIESSVDAVSLSISPMGNPLDDCLLGDAIGTLLNQDAMALTNILTELIEPELQDLGTTIEDALADAFSSLEVETEFSLGDADVVLNLFSTRFELDTTGLLIGMGARVTPSSLSQCVISGAGSDFVDAEWPEFDGTAWDTSLPYDFGLYLNRDFLDHLVWVVWASGGMCLEMKEFEGVTTSTDLFSAFLPEDFSALFQSKQEAWLTFAPAVPPYFRFQEDGPPLVLSVPAVTVEIYAKLNARIARLFEITADTEIGLDPGLTADALTPEILWDEEGIPFEESWSEILEEGFSAGLEILMSTLLGSALLPDDLLPTMDLPGLFGARLESLFWIPSDDGQWQAGFARLDVAGVQPMESPGCSGGSLGCDGGSGPEIDLDELLGCSGSGDSGCGAEGCSGGASSGCGGCSQTGGVPVGWLMVWGCLGLAVVRRR
jgi:hypothetical protein